MNKEIIENVAKAIFNETGKQDNHNNFKVWCKFYERKARAAIEELQKHYVLVPKDEIVVLNDSDVKPEVDDIVTTTMNGTWVILGNKLKKMD